MCVSCFRTSPCEVFVFSSASHCLRLPPPSPPPSLPPPQPHLTQPHLAQLISHNSSPTTSLSRNLISHNLISSPLTQQPHTAHQHLVISHNLLLHNLHGKRSIWCFWSYFCVAGEAFGAPGPTFAWQVQHLDSLGTVGGCLVAAGPRLLLCGWHIIWCFWSYFCVASAIFFCA